MKVSCVLIGALAACSVAIPASAQCPITVTNPLNLINGTWAFLTQDGLVGESTAGTFTAQIGTLGRSGTEGVLSITETFNNAGTIERQVTGTGTYQVYPDCSGGTLNFNVEGNVYQYAFVVKPGGTELYLAGSNANAPSPVKSGGTDLFLENSKVNVSNIVDASDGGSRGVAKLLSGPPTCGAAAPLSAFAGTWAFLTQDYESSSVGTFTASISPTTGDGVISMTATTSGYGGVSRLQVEVGKYQVNPDCSGGQLYFQAGGNAYQYAFTFASPTEIYMVSDNNSSPSNSNGVLRGNFGTASRF